MGAGNDSDLREAIEPEEHEHEVESESHDDLFVPSNEAKSKPRGSVIEAKTAPEVDTTEVKTKPIEEKTLDDNKAGPGVKMLPLASEEESKQYANRVERMNAVLGGYDSALKRNPSLANDPQFLSKMHQANRNASYLSDIPTQLEEIKDDKTLNDGEKKIAGKEHLAYGASFDKALGQAELDLLSRAAEEQTRGQQAAEGPDQPGFLSRAWSKVKEFGSRVSDAFSNLGDRIRGAFSRSTPDTTIDTTKTARDTTQIEKKDVEGKERDTTQRDTTQRDTTQRDTTLRDTTHQANTPPSNEEKGNHLTVEAGENGHEHKKGVGFTAIGKVDEVKHVDGKTEVDYTTHGHHQSIIVANDSPMSKAIDEFKPGDDFKFAISKDGKGHETANIEDRTTHKLTQVRDDGHTEEKQTEDKGVERKTFSR